MKTNSESNLQYIQRTFDAVLLRERNSQAFDAMEAKIAFRDSAGLAQVSDLEAAQYVWRPIHRRTYVAFSGARGSVARIPGREYGQLAYIVISPFMYGNQWEVGPEWFTRDGALAFLHFLQRKHIV